MPVSQADAWLTAHHPRGLTRDGSSTSFASGQATGYGYGYASRTSPAWSSADLEVEVAGAASGTSVLRADAVVVWLDPVPVPDNSSGRRLHVGVSPGCPPADTSIVGVRNSGADLRLRLLPAGAPTAGLECRYYGLNGHPWRLRSKTRLTAAGAARIARSMQRLALSHPVGALYHCPLADGGAEIIALSYHGRPAADLWVELNGCRFVANGFIQASLP